MEDGSDQDQPEKITANSKSNCIILPRDSWKVKWDLWVVFVLFFVAMTLPYQIGFVEEPGITWNVLNYIVDVTFLIDMGLTFFSAIQSPEDNSLICDKRQIAKAYL